MSNPANGSYLYDEGVVVQVVVTAGTLISWTLDGVPMYGIPEAIPTVTMNADHTVLLHFSTVIAPPTRHTLRVDSTPIMGVPVTVEAI